MRSKPQTFEANADECRRRATALANPELKELYESLARQWLELAGILRSLQADEREADIFFKRRM
jgi:hypothetical protein